MYDMSADFVWFCWISYDCVWYCMYYNCVCCFNGCGWFMYGYCIICVCIHLFVWLFVWNLKVFWMVVVWLCMFDVDLCMNFVRLVLFLSDFWIVCDFIWFFICECLCMICVWCCMLVECSLYIYNCVWLLYDLCMICVWIVYDVCMMCVWVCMIVVELCMNCEWFVYGLWMIDVHFYDCVWLCRALFFFKKCVWFVYACVWPFVGLVYDLCMIVYDCYMFLCMNFVWSLYDVCLCAWVLLICEWNVYKLQIYCV